MSPGIASSILRWLCHIPAGYVAVGATNNYYSLVDVPAELLDNLGSGHALVFGVHLITIVGWTVFAWNFVQFGASVMMRGALLWLTGFVDFAFALLLTVGLANMGSFLPHSIAGCGPDGEWGEKKKAGWTNPQCKDMVTLWIVTIVVTVVYYMLGTMNMLLGYRTADTYGAKGSWQFDGWDLPDNVSHKLFKPVIAVVENTWGAGIFASRLSLRVYRRATTLFKGNFSFHVSKIWKRRRQVEAPPGYELLASEGREPLRQLPLEVVYMISELVHHTDLVSLSQSSWALRTAFFGDKDPQGQLDALRKFTCDGEQWSCVVCHSQICSGCNVDDPDLGKGKHARHLSCCQPHCTPCYWRLRCGPTRQEAGLQHSDHKGGCYVTQGIGPSPMVIGMGYSPMTRKTCGRCNAVPLHRRQRATDARDEEFARQTWRGELECKACSVPLGDKALRWWVCSSCGGDCLDDMHPLTGLDKP